MPIEICEKGIIYCLDLVDDYLETKNLCIEVFSESIKNNHSVYDLYYLVLARRNGASVLSRDKKLKALAKELKIKVLE
jgi:predicted nucleic acid-binding protein